MSAGSQATLGSATKLKQGDAASPEVFTTVAEVLTLERSGRKIDLVDVTNMDSPVDGDLTWREFIHGLADGGEIKFSANYIPDNVSQQNFTNSFDGTRRNWQIVLPNSLGTWSFTGFITAADMKFPIDKQMEFSGTIKVTGADTFA